MTSDEMRAAVERLTTDPEFAWRAYEKPEAVLPVEYDLDPSQWQAVHRALVAEVDDDKDEVEGVMAVDRSGRQDFPHLAALVTPRDPPTGLPTRGTQHTPVGFTAEDRR